MKRLLFATLFGLLVLALAPARARGEAPETSPFEGSYTGYIYDIYMYVDIRISKRGEIKGSAGFSYTPLTHQLRGFVTDDGSAMSIDIRYSVAPGDWIDVHVEGNASVDYQGLFFSTPSGSSDLLVRS